MAANTVTTTGGVESTHNTLAGTTINEINMPNTDACFKSVQIEDEAGGKWVLTIDTEGCLKAVRA